MNVAAGEAPSKIVARLIPILGPFNKTSTHLSAATRFTEDLNFDSLIVMEFVAAVEDAFDISVPLNILPDVATVGELATAIKKIIGEEKS
jgi:acyl carrier protein